MKKSVLKLNLKSFLCHSEHPDVPYDTEQYSNFEEYIDSNQPIYFTKKDAIPTACGECEWPMIDGEL